MMLAVTAFAMGLATGILSGIMAQGISMLVIIPTAIASILHFHKEKLINYRVAGYLAFGAIAGSLLSSNLVQYIPAADLKRLFGVFVIFTGARMIFAKSKK